MNIDQLAREIFRVSHITGEFKLRSGIISNEYFDKYQFESDPLLLKEISNHLIAIINSRSDLEFDILAGLEVGGIPIAAVIGTVVNKNIVYVRKKAKQYGTAKLVEGTEIDGQKLLIVEDVVTSGGQIIESVNELRQRNATVKHAICVIDRQQGGKENLEKNDIELISLLTMEQIKNFSNK